MLTMQMKLYEFECESGNSRKPSTLAFSLFFSIRAKKKAENFKESGYGVKFRVRSPIAQIRSQRRGLNQFLLQPLLEIIYVERCVWIMVLIWGFWMRIEAGIEALS